MFSLIKFLLSLAVLLALVAAVLYFLPANFKIEVAQKIVGFVPDTFKEKTEELLLTPPEQRAKLIAKLEEKLAYLKDNPGGEIFDSVLQEAENLIGELKEKVTETSLTETIKTKLVDELLVKGKELIEKDESAAPFECAGEEE
ncbi:hypothetical protein HY478_02920 [Candidatus Uhrbacteria bacterium]|nr:hypothetical protein [Candidatus Uhrbacteria bacterium]